MFDLEQELHVLRAALPVAMAVVFGAFMFCVGMYAAAKSREW